MNESAHIVFYKIDEFGFYKRGSDAPLFGTVDSVLSDLKKWCSGKKLSLTKTYQKDDGAMLPAYFLDASKYGTAWLLSLWNETPSTNGAVASINGSDPVGSADITMTALKDGHIPGFSSYFWFVPELNVVASVRFQHPTARPQMCAYVQHFMANFCSHAITKIDDATNELKVEGYKESPEAKAIKARARFNVELYRKAGEQQYLLDNAQKIRKLSKKSHLTLTNRQDRAFWQQMLDSAHLTTPTNRPHEVGIRYDIDVEGLTNSEVSSIITGWNDESDDTDYGFKMVGENDFRWLGRAFARESISLNVKRLNTELIDPVSLIKELHKQRDELLKLLN